MKKIYSVITMVVVTFSVNAQNKAVGTSPILVNKANKQIKAFPMPTDRAAGDTLMWFPAPGVYLASTADQASFDVVSEDIDGLTTTNSGIPQDLGLVYSDNNDVNGMGNPTADNFYFPWENPVNAGGTDSAFFWYGSSWFNPAGTADNWLMMGPITLSGLGHTLKWYDRTNPAYRDGYKVYIQNATTVSNPASFADFTGTAVYTKTDAYPSPTYTTDTTWVLRSVTIPATFTGQSIYIAFNHNANDMDVLYLDNFTVVEAPVSVEENGFFNGVKIDQNMPNPFALNTTINYSLKEKAAVSLSVYDVTGKLVAEQFEGSKTAGNHAIKFNSDNLNSGVYYYSLKVGENTSASMKMVIVK